MNNRQQRRIRIQERLDHDARLQSSTIRVRFTNGVATLTGTVASASLKPVAQALALQVDGVQDVVNDLGVGNPATGVTMSVPRRITGDDGDLSQAVRAALDTDADLCDLPITTTVVRQRVALTGVVTSWAQCLAAARVVRAVDGVTEVVNQLVPQVLHDALTAARVGAGDGSGDGAGDGQVHLTVQDTTVAVDGMVRSWDAKQAVLEAIAETGATYGILDRLHVVPVEAGD